MPRIPTRPGPPSEPPRADVTAMPNERRVQTVDGSPLRSRVLMLRTGPDRQRLAEPFCVLAASSRLRHVRVTTRSRRNEGSRGVW